MNRARLNPFGLRSKPTALLTRLALSLLVFGSVGAWICHNDTKLLLGFVWLGEHVLGGNVPRVSGLIGWGVDGPFAGSAPVDRLCNLLCRWGPWSVTNMAAFAAAATIYLFLSRARRAGETRCGRCGYTLAGLREPRCPECGQGL